MTRATAFRGQPLLLLGGLLAGWCALRGAMWESPFEHELQAGPEVALAAAEGTADSGSALAVVHAGAPPLPSIDRSPPEARITSWYVVAADLPLAPTRLASRADSPLADLPGAVAVHDELFFAAQLDAERQLPPPHAAFGVPAVAAARPGSAPTQGGAEAASRWSADGWLLLRRDTTTPLLSGRPSYGRSQAGGVIRYELAAAHALRPQAYLRASSALAGGHEQEIAAGLSARPVRALPLRLFAEARLGETDHGTRLRPAIFAVSEVSPLKVPMALRGEAYVQGGYVGGEFATAFVDGQARLDRRIAGTGATELSAGAGAWGGAQKGAARLDIGPTAAVSLRMGNTRARIAADYRFRIAGDAQPSSGPALTVSAGF